MDHISERLKRFRLPVGIGFILSVALVVLVISNRTLPIDRPLLLHLHRFASPFLDTFFTNFSYLGDPAVLFVVCAVYGLYVAYRRDWSRARFFVVAAGGASVINVVGKALVHRVRPDLWPRIIQETSFSFPSGHAMGSLAVAMTLIYLYWHQAPQRLMVTVGALYVLLIGLSRLYLGVHFPSDVLAGWLISATWVGILIMFAPWIRGRYAK